MFDDLMDLALDGYEVIRAQCDADPPGHRSRRLGEWLRRDAVAAIDDLAARADFQIQARWSMDHLQAGAAGADRKLVDSVDAALVEHAAALARFAADGDVMPRLEALALPFPHTAAATGKVPGSSGVGTVQFIAQRPWQDLVSVRDFFKPSAGLNLKAEAGPRPHPVEFVPMFHDALRQPGDHIVGMLLRRVRYWMEDLQWFRARCTQVARDLGLAAGCDTAVLETGKQLGGCVAELEGRLTGTPDARLREACVVLVQAYAGFHPQPDLKWLKPADASGAAVIFRFWLENHDETLVASRIAAALGAASRKYRGKVPAEDVLREAARSYALVLAQGLGTRTMYWRGEPVNATVIGTAQWDTMWALALKTKQGQGLDHVHFGTGRQGKEAVSRPQLSGRINRLKTTLPGDLASRIDGKSVLGTYLLELAANEIFMGEVSEDGVVEITGRAHSRAIRAM